MKNVFILFAIFFLANYFVCAQTSNAETAKLTQINKQVAAKYKEGDFDEAAKFAQEAIDLSSKIFGAESSETAAAYANIGEIFLNEKQYEKAAANFQKSLAIYQLSFKQYSNEISSNLERMGLAFTLDGKTKQGGEALLQALKNAENTFGQDSRKLLPYLKSLSEFYIYTRKKDEAEQVFVRRYLIASKNQQPNEQELQIIEDDFECFTFQTFSVAEAAEKQDAFNRATLAVREAKPKVKSNEGIKAINGGILNGKARSLKIPNYPLNARSRKAEGTIPVRVTLDEQGNIVSAKAVCGDAELAAASEEAAKNAKFSPTVLDGKPVRVIGILIYKFMR